MPRFHLTLEYDGTDFLGWQRNPGCRTVQGTLMGAIAQVCGVPAPEAPVAPGASRTDAGVHAQGQAAAFSIPDGHPRSALTPKGWSKALNALLPSDVAVTAAREVPLDWDPRHGASGKRYRYSLLNRMAPSPFLARRTWHRRSPLDLAAMREAAQQLIGEHDFTSFRASSCTARTANRRIFRVDVERDAERPDLIHIEVEGNAFLHHMVRNIAGTLVDVGRGRTPATALKGILAARHRPAAGPTAPARGLTLVSIFYP